MHYWECAPLNGGLNVCDRPDRLEAGQASDACNVWFRRGALRSRPGQIQREDWGLTEPVDTLCDDHQGSWYIQSGGKLWRRRGGQTQELFTLSTGEDGTVGVGSFVPHSDGGIYFVNGTQFLLIDADTVQTVEPYIPLHLRTGARTGIGGAVVVERPNLLTRSIRIRYELAEEGTVNSFDLPLACKADVKPSRVVFNSTQIAVSSISGRRVTLAKNCVMNNATMEVTATLDDWSERDVRRCCRAVMFGTDSRLVLTGNGSNRYYVSGPFNPGYFPDDGEHAFGSGDPITGIGKLYDLLVMFKAREFAQIRPESNYLASTVNPVIGCDMPGSICTVGNRLVWANSYGGVQMLVSTSRANERNVRSLSRNVDAWLLREPAHALQTAAACDWDGHYLLCVGEHVYVWDYREKPYEGADENAAARHLAWYRWDGFDVQYWLTQGSTLYYLRRDTSQVVAVEEGVDDGTEVFAVRWKSGALCPGEPGRYFHADSAVLVIPRDGENSFTVCACCDEREANIPHERDGITVTASPTGYTSTKKCALRLRDAQTVSLAFTAESGGFALQGLGLEWRPGGRIRQV